MDADGADQNPELSAAADVLTAEYGVLMSALGQAWSASLTRTSLYLGVLSAAGLGFGFVARDGSGFAGLPPVALLILVLVLLLGISTFVRLVQVQRECYVYVIGMNRIRHFFTEVAPASRPYFVLPLHDDDNSLFRSIGGGMHPQRPRVAMLQLTVQTQGIVGIVTAVVAGACAALATADAGGAVMWASAVVAGVVVLLTLLVYWQRSLAAVRRSVTPLHPSN